MTREEAIKELIAFKDKSWDGMPEEVIDVAIEALEQEPCEKTQMVDKSNFSQEQYRADLQSAYDCGKASVAPCEDAISRQAVLDGLASIAKAKARSDAQKSLMGRVMFFTEHLPSVTPQQKMGHWCDEFGGCKCSECGCLEAGHSDYCPNCGARMQEIEE